MEKFDTFQGLVAPIDRPNVDTDAIIPKQFLKSIKRTGFGGNLFDEWRYLDKGEVGQELETRELNSKFVLNMERYRGASILLCRENFGCGSSREHAPWALRDFGIRALIAPSYADIFFNNSCKNGLLPVVLDSDMVQRLFELTEANSGFRLMVDLKETKVRLPDGEAYCFNFDERLRNRLLDGLDDIGSTLKFEKEIRSYEVRHKHLSPWRFL